MTRVRAAIENVRHDANASLAVATARSTSAASASATSPVCPPVAGSKTGPNRRDGALARVETEHLGRRRARDLHPPPTVDVPVDDRLVQEVHARLHPWES